MQQGANKNKLVEHVIGEALLCLYTKALGHTTQ
jgi:hypothetical protein